MNERKVYTIEDNVKSISFGIKDLVKQLEEINLSLQLVASSMQKKDDEKNLPL